MNGALLLGLISLVCVIDLAPAFYFLRMANQADSLVGAAPQAGAVNPDAARRFARVLLMATPGVWLVVALLSFGVIPVGNITPITF
ncbi:hypothetical protein [Sphingomonas mali]|uniref:hypothetical protein n=1 Tax=Sphingomonas mali TaxID=40682 RepID=UPI000833643B|nr:hypothetical protein [Sphingomonas mali]